MIYPMNNTVWITTNTTKWIVDKHDGNGGSSGHFDFSFDGYKAKEFSVITRQPSDLEKEINVKSLPTQYTTNETFSLFGPQNIFYPLSFFLLN